MDTCRIRHSNSFERSGPTTEDYGRISPHFPAFSLYMRGFWAFPNSSRYVRSAWVGLDVSFLSSSSKLFFFVVNFRWRCPSHIHSPLHYTKAITQLMPIQYAYLTAGEANALSTSGALLYSLPTTQFISSESGFLHQLPLARCYVGIHRTRPHG